MKSNFSLDKTIAGIILLGAFLSVVAVTMTYGGISNLPVNFVRFFDLDARQAFTTSTAGSVPNLNTEYAGILIGILVSAWLNVLGQTEHRVRKAFKRLVFSGIVAAIFFNHFSDAISCGAVLTAGYISNLAIAFTLGFTTDELALKIARIARTLQIDGPEN
ncbi:hypothetical protein [Paraburkholderia sp. BCC1885]|uniref:hypothetical protein n=1 Tax=Paraburkholderia sp. BCC1885 TaxID=2562669 RepID=UPI0011825DD5|nr:hypothetical protein [Paraburkholderia sp. BCC1885]